jgi:predicted transcriptional regulator
VAGRKSIEVTDKQYQALELLWRHGALTVRELLEHLPAGTPYTTALGLLQNMEKAGLVRAVKEQSAHRFEPTMTREQGMRRLLQDFAARFFGGSAKRLAMGLVETGELTPEELRELEAKLKGDKPRKGRT